MQCAVYACGLLGRLTGEKRAVCSTCPEQRRVLCYCTWPNDQLRIELLSSCLVLGCSEHSQLPDSMRASTFCQFELILSILITSISGIRLRKCILDTGPVTKTAVWDLLHKNNTFSFFSKADSVGHLNASCKMTIFYYLEQKVILSTSC